MLFVCGEKKTKIDNWTSDYLIDSLLYWTSVNGFYKAIGGENEITLGSLEDQKTMCAEERHKMQEGRYAYYLFDNVYLAELKPLMITLNNFSPDTFFIKKKVENEIDSIYSAIKEMKKQSYLLLELKIKESDSLSDKIKAYATLNGVSEERILFKGIGENVLKNILYRDSDLKPLGVKWSTVIKILGIHISYDQNVMEEKNMRSQIIKIKKKLDLWKQRDLTICGKVLILKS